MVKNKKKRELNDLEKGMILAYHDMGLSERQITEKVGCGKTTVHDLLVKKEETGSTDNRPSGRPRATTSAQDKYIRVTSLMDRFRPCHEIAQNVINSKSKLPVCRMTVSNRLNDVGLGGRIARNKPKLTKKQRRARLKWARKYRNWTTRDWELVYWSDESPFNLFV